MMRIFAPFYKRLTGEPVCCAGAKRGQPRKIRQFQFQESRPSAPINLMPRSATGCLLLTQSGHSVSEVVATQNYGRWLLLGAAGVPAADSARSTYLSSPRISLFGLALTSRDEPF